MSHMHHGMHMVWTDSNWNVCLSWDMLKQFFGARLHAIHEGDDMLVVHVVHYVKVAHLIIRRTTAERIEKMNKLFPIL